MTADAASGSPVEVMIEDARWEAVGLEALAEEAVRAALDVVGRDPERHEISLLACNDARIAELNEAFRGRAAATNVLSWPAFDGLVPEQDADGDLEPLFLGDLALAYETCAGEAAEAGQPFEAHLRHLVVHGVMHLLGHDHETDDAADEMEAFEAKILARMGVPNPYV
jgi:probable rRNA maturation factor